jgi:DNA-binding CsgD family transcriptional regulator
MSDSCVGSLTDVQTVAWPGRLVGRDSECATLRRLVAGLIAGQGGSVWIEGEPGIGKSALVAEALAEARRSGCQVFTARADEGAAWFPLRVLLDALRVNPSSADELRSGVVGLLWAEDSVRALTSGAVTPGDVAVAAAERLLILVQQLCRAGPVMLAVDALQWADELSLAVWGRLHRLVDQLPLLLVATCRPVPARAEVDRLRRAVAGGGERLVLGALADADVAVLIGRLVGAAPGPDLCAQAAQAAGNPLYIGELVDALTREHRIRISASAADLADGGTFTPVSLAAAITGRLGFLSDQATSALRMAALLGAEFSVEHLSVLYGRTAADLAEVVREAVAAGVLEPAADRLAFRHGLIHKAMYEAVPAGLRSALHRQVAQALAAAGAPAEAVAEQLIAAPGAADGWVAGWLVDAAPGLIDRATQVAVDLLRRALDRAGMAAAHRERLDAHLAAALFRLGRYEEIEPVAAPALAIVREPQVAGQIAWTLGYALVRLTRYEQALRVVEETLTEHTLSGVWEARLLALQAMILSSGGRRDEAEAIAGRAEAAGRRAGDRLATGYALHTLAYVRSVEHRDHAAGLDTLDRALAAIGEGQETADLRLLLLGNRSTALANLGRLAEADRVLGQALALAEPAGSPNRLAALRVQVAEYCFFAGRWDDAVAELHAAAEFVSGLAPRLVLRGLETLIAVHRDDRTTATRDLGDVADIEITAGEMRYHAQFLLVARALTAERDHTPDQALAALLAAFDPESTLHFPQLTENSALWLPDVVRLALGLGRRDVAEAAADAADAEATRQPLPQTRAGAEHCRGLLAANPDAVRSAAEAYREIGHPLYHGQALENAAFLLACVGDTTGARAAYAGALQIYTALDAAWDCLRADARLRPLGIRRGVRGPRHRPTTGWEALTPTELKIADYVAAGYTNPDIATEMFLSRSTVNTHISHILTKLGAHSRVDIARECMRRHAP